MESTGGEASLSGLIPSCRVLRRWLLRQRSRVYVLLIALMCGLLILQYSVTVVILQNKRVDHLVQTLYPDLRPGGADPEPGHSGPRGNGLWDALFGGGTSKSLEDCPETPWGLEGHVDVTYERLAWRELDELFPEVAPGGLWSPGNCSSRHRVAIIVPYRDRSDHLRVFLRHIHPFLQRQLVDYGIYVIEQDPYSPFNRGMLLNIGFKEAMADRDYACAIFHDVDLLPEDDRNMYYCPEQPRHMSAAVDEFAYRLPYDSLFGGIEAFKKEHFQLINGFSNKYFGWGAEDDDLYQRIEWHNLNLTRYPMSIARYSMIRHMKNEPNPSRLKYLGDNRIRFSSDGLNSLKYDRKRFERRKLFTWVYARINQTAILQDLK